MKSRFNIVFLITVCTLLGKVLGVIKDCLLSYYYGTTSETDAFFLAMSVPTLMIGIFTSSTDSAIIPQYKRVMLSSSKKTADALFSMIVNTLSVIAVGGCLFIFLWPTMVVKLFGSGFDEHNIIQTAKYLQIFAPIGLLHLLYCFFCAYNAAFEKYIARTVLAFSTNLILVIFLFLIKGKSLLLLSFAYLASCVVSVVLPFVEMRKNGYRNRYSWNQIDAEYKKFWLLFLPIIGGAFLHNLQQYVDKNLCSGIEGGISYLNYGNKLVNIFDSVFVVGIAVVILPMLSDFEHNKEFKELSKIASRITRYMMEIFVPCMAILFILSQEFIMLLFGGGKFGADSVSIVSDVLKAYSPLILLTPLVTIFSKFFHVKERNEIPFRVNLLGVVLNICLSILLKESLGVIGVAAATTIAMAIEIVIYIILIQKFVRWDINELQFRRIIGIILPTVLLSILPSLHESGLSSISLIAIKSIMISSIYMIFYWLLLRDDMRFWMHKGKSIFGR